MSVRHISVAILMMLVATAVALPTIKDDAEVTKLPDYSEPQNSQPEGTRPRTWNKPYYGTPSAQCRRNPGTSSLVPSKTTDLTQLADPVSLDGEHEDRDAGSNTILPRQPHEQHANINNNLLAAIHFSCPQGGAMSQVFMWGVVYMPGATNVYMVPWHNILGFTGTRLARNTGRWASAWDSMWCVPHDKLECWYTATAFTIGALDHAREHISIDLITNPQDQRYAPMIHESCVEIGASRVGAVGATCIIQEVQINVQGPIG